MKKRKYSTALAETAEGYILQGEDGETTATLSNFILKVKKRIMKLCSLIFIVDVMCGGKVEAADLSVSAEIFNDLKVFKNFFQRWIFFGPVSALNLLKEHLLQQEANNAVGADFVGFHQHNGQWVYVDSSGTINAENAPVETICLINDQVSIQSGILEAEPILKEEMESLAPHLFAFNDPPRAIAILLSFLVHFIQARLWNLGFKSPHLEVTGESGSGKSETLDMLMNLFSVSIKNSCEQLTKFSLLKYLSETNFFPFFCDEQKFSGRLSYIADILKDILRSSYDHSTGSRGQKDQSVRQYPYRRLCCFFGEQSLQETALKERQIKVHLSKLTTLEHGQTEHFMFLKNHTELLEKLGKSLLLKALATTDDELLKNRKEIEKNIKSAVGGKIKSSRVLNNITALMHSYRLIKQVADKLGVPMQISEGKALDSVIQIILSDTLDDASETLSAADHILEAIDVMLLDSNRKYDLTNSNTHSIHVIRSSFSANNTELRHSKLDKYVGMDITRLYPVFRQYYKNHNLDIELLPERDFKKNLKKMPYFLWEGSMRFSGGGNRGFKLNMSIARELGLELPFLYSIAGLEEAFDEQA
ncbi:MAG TPA: hypothetical protein PLD55_14665 [bacterium]|nr:hypothetical protein [bacterium]